MRILVNDHSGHSFTIQLSRYLTLLDHDVMHSYSTSFQSPKGDFSKKHDDNDHLTIVPIANKNTFVKYSLFKRRKQELEYAHILIHKLNAFKPEVVLSGNTPLFVQDCIQKYCKQKHIKYVYWCQDIYAIAIEKIVRKKIGLLGWPVWQFFYALEKRLLKNSDAIISITDDFDVIFKNWRVEKSKITCIPNWAPINDIALVLKENPWSSKHDLQNKFCVVYTGTLGLKHNPSILSNAAVFFKNRKDIVFVIVSEGIGANYLYKQKKLLGLDNLQLFPFQPFSELSNVLGTADILVSILEEDAGIFSVPSKVLTYLCAQKPIILSVPSNNLSAKIVRENQAGLQSKCNDTETFYENIQHLISNSDIRQKMGENGRKYAKDNFIIEKIGSKILNVLEIDN